MKVPIDEAPAGREMDAAVAKALGFCPHDLEKAIHWSEDGCGEVYYKCKHCLEKFWGLAYREGYHILPYSTDIAAAWELDEPGWWWGFREASNILTVTLYTSTDMLRKAMRFYPRVPEEVVVMWQEWKDDKASTYAVARCRAFLKASGIEYVEVLE